MLAKKKLSVLMLTLAFSSAAWAGLGSIAVRSNLGEPLRAEIDFTGTDNELLRIGLAGTDTFRDLKVDYSAVLTNLRFTLAQRSNGRSYIRVSSSTPISEPYLRFVVEARMPNGRSIREYTILLDPADYDKKAEATTSTARPVFEPDLPRAAAVAKNATTTASHGKVTPVRSVPGTIVVRQGQSLRQLAASLGITGASLRQVMAALVEANPDAFTDGDPHRLQAGARLNVPALRKMKALGADKVNAILGAAANVAAPVPSPVAESPKTEAVAKPAPAAAPPPAAHTEQLKLEPIDATASAPVADASAAIAQSEQALLLQQAQRKIVELEARLKAMQPASAPKAVPKHDAEPQGESLLDSVMGYLPLVGGALVAGLLATAGVIMWRRRRTKATNAASAVGAVLDKDAVSRMNMAAAGGNTFLTDFTRTGMASTEAGDVDPIAEAEVYLAYGRDQQAEEILKDALAKDPTRHEVRAKLLEIYASRHDNVSFEPHAAALHAALDGKGSLWDKVAKLGLALDPANALYGAAAGGIAAAGLSAAQAMHIDLDSELMGDDAATAEIAAAPAPAVQDDDDPFAALLADDPPPAAEPSKALAPELDIESLLAAEDEAPAAKEEAPEDKHMLDFDFNLDEPLAAAAPAVPAAVDDDNSVDFDFDMALAAADEDAPTLSTDGLSVSDDPLTTKLDLARVYLDMGDKDGAREVLEELVSEADGTLKQQASSLLSSL